MVQRRPQALPLVGTRPTGPAQLNFPVRSYVKENQSLPITFQRRPTVISWPTGVVFGSFSDRKASTSLEWKGIHQWRLVYRRVQYVHYLHMACIDC